MASIRQLRTEITEPGRKLLLKLIRARTIRGASDRGIRNVLVDARRPMNYAVIAPIHKSLGNDPRVKFYFTASEQPASAREIYRYAGDDIEIVGPRHAAWMKFDAYLTADLLWLPLPRGARRVMMFHGVAGKYSHVYDKPDRSMREWDRLFFINGRRLSNFISAGAIDADSPAAKLIGMPRVDCLVDGTLSRDEVLGGLGLDPSKPSVLYAPTWSPHSSLNLMGKELITRLGRAGYNVIIKLHDGSRMPGAFFSGGVDWVSELAPIVKRMNGHLAGTPEISPLLAAADVLITDHSSVGFEYLLLDRPLVRIHVPQLIANTNIASEYVDILKAVSTSITEPDEIELVVEESLANPTARSALRRAAARDLFYEPGTATPRAVAELLNVLELDSTASPCNVRCTI
ncbi:MAG TPA: CDP-glycerol glycerophosphotransferase family protein [Blastocatellia bacterium]